MTGRTVKRRHAKRREKAMALDRFDRRVASGMRPSLAAELMQREPSR